MESTQKVTTEPDELAEKTWTQLRQSTIIALAYLRRWVDDGSAPSSAYDALAEIETVLAP